jgi:hypothetical protein
MQDNANPREPDQEQPKGTTAWWLMLVIFGLLGLIAAQLVQRLI